jgi:hypothetical protein
MRGAAARPRAPARRALRPNGHDRPCARTRRPIADQAARLAPTLEQLGIAWKDFDGFLALREALFEIDTRFGELGERGIFATLDGAAYSPIASTARTRSHGRSRIRRRTGARVCAAASCASSPRRAPLLLRLAART